MSEHSESADMKNAVATAQDLKDHKAPWIIHSLVSLGLIIIAMMAVYSMFATKPEARKWGGRPAPAVTVETTKLNPSDYQVWIDSFGSATPLTLTKLVSDVSGRVIEVSENIRAGKTFEKGDILLKIEPRDFAIAVNVAEAAVANAEVQYAQELAEAEIARQEWNTKPNSRAGKRLALREPQVKAALASLQSAKARLDQAKLDLERTEVRAPFKGKVLTQMVDLGQVINPQQAIAEIYATDQLEIRLPIKTQDLHQLELARLDGQGTPPQVVLESTIGDQAYEWYGQIVRSEGAYDRDSRMLYVVARVNNPFVETDMAPAMRVGQFFEAKIEGRLLTNVFALPRRSVSQDSMISLASEGQLKKLPIKTVWTDTENVIIDAQNLLGEKGEGPFFTKDDYLILTPTANLVPGTRVKLIGEEQPPNRQFAGKGKQPKTPGATTGADSTSSAQ